MKNIISLAIALALAPSALAQRSTQPPPDTARTPGSRIIGHVIGKRGENSREWLKILEETNALGQVELTTNVAYVEVAAGLHVWEDNQWRESREEFEITAQGNAEARHGRHRVNISSVLNDANGVVELFTPEGHRMRSTILGLTLHDRISGTNVLLATIKNGVTGRKVAPNEILFTNCFDSIRADVRFVFQRGAFHQDVIVREAIDPAQVEALGCNPNVTRLEIWTEFFEAPTPRVKQRFLSGLTDPALRGLVAVPDVVEDELDFGSMKMPLGRAYAQRSATANQDSIHVSKRWLQIDGRSFVVESMSLVELKPLFAGLPEWNPSLDEDSRPMYAGMRPPSPVLVTSGTNSILTASLDSSLDYDASGVVLDYQLVSGTSSFTFKEDTTYYIDSDIWIYNVILEGGTVIKYAPGNGRLNISGSVTCKTDPYRPAVFTSKNCDTVGEIISGSTGVPSSNEYNSMALRIYDADDAVLKHLRISHVGYGVNNYFGNVLLSDSQFVHCRYPISGYQSPSMVLRNVLMFDVPGDAFSLSSSTVSAEHLTVNQGFKLVNGSSSSFAITNSLVTGVQWWGSVPSVTNNVVKLSSASGVYQTVGAGNCYLATNSPYRNAGTTNINPSLLVDLQKRTTYAPTLYTNVTHTTNFVFTPQVPRDTNAATLGPDIGYHYTPLDYLLNYFAITNASLTATSGVAIATYLDSAGIWLQDGSAITAIGTPDEPIHFTHYNTVQEQSVFLSSLARSNFTYACIINPYHVGSTLDVGATGTFRFAKFDSLAASGVPFYQYKTQWDFKSLDVRDCEIGTWYGNNQIQVNTNTTTTFANNLFRRTQLTAVGYLGAQLTFSNNLFWGSSNVTMRPGINGSLFAFNNAFDSCYINSLSFGGGVLSNDFNAYLNCTGGTVPLLQAGSNNIISTNALAYQTGPLGDFYQPTNSPLRDAGSVSNAALVGFYYYTTTTNQVWETNSVLDIGYHYVSVDTATGLPIDSDWDGIPDYADPDSDNDGLPDEWEIQFLGGLDQLANGDFDGDGMTNLEEYQHGFDPANPDEDQNGILDGDDDWDGDLLSNKAELRKYFTKPLAAYSEPGQAVDDGLYKVAGVEVEEGSGPSPTELQLHYSLENIGGVYYYTVTLTGATPGRMYEFLSRYVPASGPWSHWQVWFRTNAPPSGTIVYSILPVPPPGYIGQVDIAGVGEDSDGDGLSDIYELMATHTLPDVADTDGDGTPDGLEDPDGDGLTNVAEYHFRTDPNNPDSVNDTDGDGLTILEEGLWGTDPASAATWQLWIGAPKQQSNLP